MKGLFLWKTLLEENIYFKVLYPIWSVDSSPLKIFLLQTQFRMLTLSFFL